MNDRFDLSGKVAFVNGGAGLIGSAISTGLVEHGATVVIVDVNERAGSELAEEIGERGEYMHADMCDSESVEAVFDSITSEYEQLNVLVNCAYPRNQAYGRQYEQVTITDFRENVSDNLDNVFLSIRQAVELMRNSGGGDIINLGSIYGLQAPDFGVYEETNMTSPVEYAAIKGAVLNLTRYLASYLAPDDIRVNAVSPGGVFDDQPDRFVENYEQRTPLGRMAVPEDIVGAVVYLASDASSYVTGHNLIVDGGWSIQ